MANLPFQILTTLGHRAKNELIEQTKHPLATQEKYLKTLLQHHQKTELGRHYHLEEIKTIDQFRSRIPILPYSAYDPYTQRIAQGEKNVLTPDPVIYINITSGSTGKQKKIPVTQRFQNSLGKANLASMGFLDTALRQRGKKLEKLLVTNPALIRGYTEGGLKYGPAGPGVLHTRKWLYEWLFAHPFTTLQVADSFTRTYLCLLFSLRNEELGGLIANFPMLILRICHYLEKYAESFIQDLERGTLPKDLDLDSKMRSRLNRRFSASPKRARELREILNTEGRLTPPLAWKNLAYITTARGGTSDFYLQHFSDYDLDHLPVFGGAFASAEGTFSVYTDVNNDASALAVNTGFFEFIPESEWDQENPQTLLATEVKPGERYRILVSNYSGFYRYDIGDVVEIGDFFEQSPTLIFRHRRGGILSSTSEKTTEAHVIAVLRSLQEEWGMTIHDFFVTLSEKEFPPHYLLNIELPPESKLEESSHFLRRFDELLKETNPHYALKREGEVPPPRLRILAPGSFDIVRERLIDRGVPDSQMKLPHISEDRQLFKGLTVQQEITLET
ncbi:GH3 auxin-responsive promoter family protein [Euhalothece natronophila Z-M001]|uniref:GH3 auxin-responsive promoter family protein n=1 Tax=Euhalothece natronophila Z-M001 TaxID=522448 RepID=A0A5B8NQH0_9CHRO|nr:GH3 auxin-responsive promoter family protein [Euhalothece natronophila]QDZ41284.1 GH3 auxin-responsive promoter family protein [Euhalothece natronophila Z-M001]